MLAAKTKDDTEQNNKINQDSQQDGGHFRSPEFLLMPVLPRIPLDVKKNNLSGILPLTLATLKKLDKNLEIWYIKLYFNNFKVNLSTVYKL